MTQLKISIALAAYCGQRYLTEQLQSLFRQTVCPDEIVICDDSPDTQTEQCFRDTAKLAPPGIRMRYFRNGKPLGIAGNFERTISLTTGDVIFLCDQDDCWQAQKIEKYLELWNAHPEYDGIFADSMLADETLMPLHRTLWQMRNFTPETQKRFLHGEEQLAIFLQNVCCSSHNIAFRSTVKSQLLPFPELKALYADSWIGLALAVNGSWGILPETLTLYRIHNHNQSAPGRRSLRKDFLDAKKARHNGHLLDSVSIAEAILQRSPLLTAGQRNYLERYRDFYAMRARLSGSISPKIPKILKAWHRGDYRNFARSWKTALIDLLLA